MTFTRGIIGTGSFVKDVMEKDNFIITVKFYFKDDRFYGSFHPRVDFVQIQADTLNELIDIAKSMVSEKSNDDSSYAVLITRTNPPA